MLFVFGVVVVELVFSLSILISDAYDEDMSDSDAESDSLQGSDEDGFLEDDDNNVVMIVD